MTGADTATGGYLVSRYLVTHSSYLPPPCQTCQLVPAISPNITKLWLHSLNFTVLQPLTKMGSNNYIVGIYLPPNILACGKLVLDDPKLEPASGLHIITVAEVGYNCMFASSGQVKC